MVSKTPNNIEEFLKTRFKHHVLSDDLFRDVCRRIKKLEKK